jgi:hypothetical protein
MATSAQTIQDALQRVAQFRQQHASDPALARSIAEVKRFQACRFQATYADLLHNPRYARAARFFLTELYSEKDYASRDQQFSRIASTIARLFPQPVVVTAAALAEVHALTETLDDQMAHAWRTDSLLWPHADEPARYVRCWRHLANRSARQHQLDVVLHLGQKLDGLTRTRGLRTLLRMMRRPAEIAGLGSLQQFLETGFDAFAQMDGAKEFLMLVRERESEWIGALFDEGEILCATRLGHLLATHGAK